MLSRLRFCPHSQIHTKTHIAIELQAAHIQIHTKTHIATEFQAYFHSYGL